MTNQSSKEHLFEIIEKFKDLNILVVGDIIIDEYIWGKANRLSPEAPVPVLEVSKYSYVLGGAANVANNIAALGGNAILAGVVGQDDQANIFYRLLKEANIDYSTIVADKDRPTTIKTRLIAHNYQQLARADREVKTPISMISEEKLLSNIEFGLEKIDLVVLSDYAKGVLTTSLTAGIINLCKTYNKKVLVDPKGLNFAKYKGANLITPNRLEAEMATKSPTGSNPKDMAQLLAKQTEAEHVLVTLGEEGVLSYSNGDISQIPAVTSEVYDVTGAGDSLISTLALAFPATSGDLYNSILLANYAAGVVVRKTGTTTVSPGQLKNIIEINMSKNNISENKVY